MDPDAIPLEEYLKPLPAHAAHAELQDRYVSLHVQKELPCNWKAASEAFVESYHTPVTHWQLKKGTGDINTQYDTFSDHVNRLFSLAGVASPDAGDDVSQQEIVDTLVLGDRSMGGGLKVPEHRSLRLSRMCAILADNGITRLVVARKAFQTTAKVLEP